MRCAVCCVAKNESKEILYWISWYIALGFDTVILFDDNSIYDSVAKIIRAKGNFDIRLIRVSQSATYHAVRQVQIYNHVSTTYRDEFDWIAFFDADEYLDLYGEDIKDFLSRMNDYDSVAFNWANYGWNGHVMRPSGPPVLAYTKHGAPDLFWNRHTKVITRPTAIPQNSIAYVHASPVPAERTASADGQPIRWLDGHRAGLTQNEPDWKGGRLIHLQARSMENYVQREYLREDLRRHPDDPSNSVFYDPRYNEQTTPINVAYVEKMFHLLHFMSCNFMRSMMITLEENYLGLVSLCKSDITKEIPIYQESKNFSQGEKNERWTSDHSEPSSLMEEVFSEGTGSLFELETFERTTIGIKNGNVSLDPLSETPKLLALALKGKPILHLMMADFGRFSIRNDPRVLRILTYEVHTNSDGSISLTHPRTGRYVSARMNSREVEVGLQRAYDWEKFYLRPIEMKSSVNMLARFLESVTSLRNFVAKGLATAPMEDAIAAAFCTLPSYERKAIARLAGEVPEFIY
ncbi:glycosyltransferase family 2 protein [Gluconobacter morbifer]|uniref:Uncharacterized protein n=1 Tax=Gluconobacter morbifer G707 TaxID=1088869 RepID=G6XL74_9PROT|nr:glycosyltransferase family 2 protein [Gluconobacter morbifer]EHH67502.1 hypothetical protein GMO_24970 [Gluconobacter morbifer G707]